MNSNCIFCQIVAEKSWADIVYRDEFVLAFKDINPKAPLHLLIVPQKHISTVNDLSQQDEMLVGKLFLAASSIAAQQGIAEDGYRLVMNCNEYGGQSVYHLHLHLLGGRVMSWPPG